MALDPFLADKAHLLSGFDWSMLDDPEFQRRYGEYQVDPHEWLPPASTAEPPGPT